MGAVVAVLAAQRARQERELVEHLRQNHAFSATTATALRPQGRIGQAILRELVRRRAVLETGGDLFWLDESVYAEIRASRQRFATTSVLVILAASVGVIALIMIFGRI